VNDVNIVLPKNDLIERTFDFSNKVIDLVELFTSEYCIQSGELPNNKKWNFRWS